MDCAAARSLFPVTDSTIFLNHAAIAPISTPVVEAMSRHLQEVAMQGSARYGNWLDTVAATRRLAADLIGATEEEVALVGNTSSGIACIAEAFPWQAGDAVMFPLPDYPANLYPWLHLQGRGVECLPVQRERGVVGPEQLDRAYRPHVRLLALSSVDFATGFAADLPAIGRWCAEHGIQLAVDAIQSLGVLPLDVRECGIHFLAAGGHKWLLGPMGTGLLYIAADQLPRLRPPLVGWKSVRDPEDFSLNFVLRRDAALFEPGTLNMVGIVGLEAALQLLREIGSGVIGERVLTLHARLATGCESLGLRLASPTEPRHRAGIVSVEVADPETVFRKLSEAGVFLSLRDRRLRFAPHFYNSEEEIDRTLELLAWSLNA